MRVKLTHCSICIPLYWCEGLEEAAGSKPLQQNVYIAIMVTKKQPRSSPESHCLGSSLSAQLLMGTDADAEKWAQHLKTLAKLLHPSFQQQAVSCSPWVFKSAPFFSLIERLVSLP